jgi:hypothetical protein
MGGGDMSPKIGGYVTDQPRWHRNARHPKLVSCHWFWLGVRATATPATHGSRNPANHLTLPTVWCRSIYRTPGSYRKLGRIDERSRRNSLVRQPNFDVTLVGLCHRVIHVIPRRANIIDAHLALSMTLSSVNGHRQPCRPHRCQRAAIVCQACAQMLQAALRTSIIALIDVCEEDRCVQPRSVPIGHERDNGESS